MKKDEIEYLLRDATSFASMGEVKVSKNNQKYTLGRYSIKYYRGIWSLFEEKVCIEIGMEFHEAVRALVSCYFRDVAENFDIRQY